MKLLSLLCLATLMSTQVFGANQPSVTPSLVSIANTDGVGLKAKPLGNSRQEKQQIYNNGLLSCKDECVTPIAQILGQADGVYGYSNCKSTCILPKYSFMDLQNKSISIHKTNPNDEQKHYVGLIYQCVEYARRWWMKNLGITFGDIDSAHEIIYLTTGKNIHNNKSFDLARSINGTAKRPPKKGDLLIYYPNFDDPNWRYGHVAVVVGVDLENGVVDVAEQNYNNQPWKHAKKHSRQIQLFSIAGQYHVLDIDSNKNNNPSGGLISGWIYPALNQ